MVVSRRTALMGKGSANGQAVADGDLLGSDGLTFDASEAVQLIAVTLSPQ